MNAMQMCCLAVDAQVLVLKYGVIKAVVWRYQVTRISALIRDYRFSSAFIRFYWYF